MKKCLKASVLAPNSSNLQPWEFYWIRNHKKKEQVEACFSQNAAKTAKEIVIAVSRIDLKRNRDLIINHYKTKDKLIPVVDRYYNQIIPLVYTHDRLGIIGVLKKFIYIFF